MKLEEAIIDAFKKGIEDEREKFIEEAAEEFKIKLRQRLIRESAILLEASYDMRMHQGNLTITIKGTDNA